MKIIEKILDITTGEETLLEREETKDEEKARLDAETQRATIEAERLEKENAKQAVLTKLGLTADEVAALLG